MACEKRDVLGSKWVSTGSLSLKVGLLKKGEAVGSVGTVSGQENVRLSSSSGVVVVVVVVVVETSSSDLPLCKLGHAMLFGS